MVKVARTAVPGIVLVALLASPRDAQAGVELSARMPVGLAIGDGTRFELGLRSDLIYLFDSSRLGLGVAGEFRSVSFREHAQEVGGEVALPDRNLVLDAGYGVQGKRRYVHSRAAYQARVRLRADSTSFVYYALSSGIFVDVRRTVSGPGGWEGVAGVELGGGLLGLIYASTRH